MDRTTRLAAFKKRIPVYRRDPVLFAKEVCKFTPDEWQQKVLHDIATSRFVSIRSGQGVGKTGLESIVALWFVSCFPFPKVVATAPTRQQLHDVLWAEISKWQTKSPILKVILKWTKTKIYMRSYEERWFATARTATKPENMQGFHEDYMLFIVDEASGVDDKIMEAILGTLSGPHNKLLMCGNPTRTSGTFYDSHNKDRETYKTHKVSCLDSPRTSKENIDMLKKKYGEGSDVWRLRVEGEFPRGELDTFISLEAAEHALGTEMWASIKTMLEENLTNFINGQLGVLQIPDDDKLISRLSTRKWRMSSKGKMLLERKEELKKKSVGFRLRTEPTLLF